MIDLNTYYVYCILVVTMSETQNQHENGEKTQRRKTTKSSRDIPIDSHNKIIICPKCHTPASFIREDIKGNKAHYYYGHYDGFEKLPDGKVKLKIRYCYIGSDSFELPIEGNENDQDIVTYREKVINYVKDLLFSLIETKTLSVVDLVDILQVIRKNINKIVEDEYDKEELLYNLDKLREVLNDLKISN